MPQGTLRIKKMGLATSLQKHVGGADCTATVADRRRTCDNRKIQSAIDRRHGHVYVVLPLLLSRAQSTSVGCAGLGRFGWVGWDGPSGSVQVGQMCISWTCATSLFFRAGRVS